MADVECPICLVTLCCEGGGEVMSLSCAHSFHKDCFATYCATTNVSMDTVKCPCCKRTSADVAALQTVSTVPDDNNEGLVISDDDAALQTSSSASGNGAASARVGMTHPVFDAPTVFCSYCGSQAAVQKCRLTAKAAGRWQCNQCNSRLVALHRGFGSWPTNEFKSLPKAEQQAFMRSVGSAGPGTVMARAKELMSAHEQHEQFYECAGEFLPLGVWKARGFDDQAILAKSLAEDKQSHAVLGDVYRVKTLKSGSRGSEGSSRTTALSAKRPKILDLLKAAAAEAPAQSLTPGEADPTAEPSDDDADGSGDSDAESTSSSESSSSRKNKSKKNKRSKAKKTKKTKKHSKKSKKDKHNDAKKAKSEEKKRAEKEKQALARATSAKEKANAVLAQQIVTKISSPISTLATTMARPDCAHLPDFVSGAARSHMANLQNMMKQAEQVLKDNSKTMTVSSIKEVRKMVSEAKKTEVLMNQMLTTMGKIAC